MEEQKINWRQKLSSRKFWAAVAGFISGLIAAFGATKDTATQVSGLILSAGSVVAYLICESRIDAARAGAEQVENWDEDELE